MSDLISRQAAIDAIDKIFPADPMRNDYTQGITCGAALATEYIKQLPSAQPERLKGKWIHQSKFSRVECDQCGKVFRNTFAPKNFCPNCGADMRGEQE